VLGFFQLHTGGMQLILYEMLGAVVLPCYHAAMCLSRSPLVLLPHCLGVTLTAVCIALSGVCMPGCSLQYMVLLHLSHRLASSQEAGLVVVIPVSTSRLRACAFPKFSLRLLVLRAHRTS
jgi:hypothetical protein